MKHLALLIPLLLLLLTVHAQKTTQKTPQKSTPRAIPPPPVNEYAAIDEKAMQLPESLTKTTKDIAGYINSEFNTENEKVRAIYSWITTNIQYDIENTFAINFYEPEADKINKPLLTRKGICGNYAALFHDLCAKTGIQSYVIDGYTKQLGVTDYIPHAWCAAYIDSTWYMFDPTWGSGYVSDGKFVRKVNYYYFKTNPTVSIKTHMPFDYLWQFLYYPITNQEFYEGKIEQNTSKPYFNFRDSIKIYNQLDSIMQMTAAARRIEQNGLKNGMIFDRLRHLRLSTGYNVYNTAVNHYNEAVNLYNQFINYKNQQFKPLKADSAIQKMIDMVAGELNRGNVALAAVSNPDPTISSGMTSLSRSIEEISVRVKEEQEWLKKYFSKGKLSRRSMFYRVTWFGIPLNK